MLVIDGVKIVLNGAYEKELRNEILDKCMFLLTLIKGTIPMNREIGLDPDIISKPAYMELIDEFEPRAVVEEVLFEMSGGAGNMSPKVVLTYNGE